MFLYALFIVWLYSQFGVALDWAIGQIPTWLNFLVPIAWFVFGISSLLAFGYSFALLATIIASPFNALLAEKVAGKTGSRRYDAPLNAKEISALIRRSIRREIIKISYFLPRMIAVLLLGCVLRSIPLIGFVASILVFLWAAWSMCIQYVDYPADNDGIDFRSTIEKMKTKQSQSVLFGILVTILIGVPVLNLFAMPAVVADATLFWMEQLSDSSDQI